MKMNKQQILLKAVIIAVIIVLAGFLLFQNLGVKPFRIWDESRLAANSIEMYLNGYTIVPTYEGEPDMWNTKPPLLIWLQVTSMKISGISEWSIRLPSALAGMGITLMLFLFVRRITGNLWIAAFAALIPVTSAGFLMWHSCRSGEYDALLALLITGYSIAFFRFSQEKRSYMLYLTMILIALAILAKSTAALIPLPGLILWAFISSNGVKLLKEKDFWLSFVVLLIIVMAYYLGREAVNPGYLKTVDANEIRGRFLEVSEGNRGAFMFYIKKLSGKRFGSWFWILLFSVPLSLMNRKVAERSAAIFSIIMWASFLLLISISKTKLVWYDVPAYPFFAITIGMALRTLWQLSAKINSKIALITTRVLFILLAILALAHPYHKMASAVTTLYEEPWDEELYHIQYLLKEAIAGEKDISGYKLLYDPLQQRTTFYTILYGMDGERTETVRLSELQPGDSLIVYNPTAFETLKEHYHIKETEEVSYSTIKLITIEGYLHPEKIENPL